MPKNKAQLRLAAINGGRRYATITAAAEYLAAHPSTIRKMIAQGHIKVYTVDGRLYRVDLNELDAVMSGETA